MSLRNYRQKRDFGVTSEPQPRVAKRGGASKARQFVIQKHAASHLHYDLRLEVGGVFKSWACPKGLPTAHGGKHLAVMVEDHPLEYGDFEGTIPKGEYGGGTVMVWDKGTFEPLTPLNGLAAGKLHFRLHGEKLEGEWYLVRFKGDENQWLVIKGGESMKPVSKRADNLSALSGKTMAALAKGERIWHSRPAGPSSRNGKAVESLSGFVAPMKARVVAKPPAGEWLYEIKFDGWRALALKGGQRGQGGPGKQPVRLFSRNEKEWSGKFPEVVEALSQLDTGDAGEALLDGEIVALDKAGHPSFQLLQAYEMGEERPPLFYYAFDLLRLDGEDLRGKPLEERRALLEKLIGKGQGAVRFSASLGSDAARILAQMRKLKLEGVIGKRVGSLYESGKRSGAWIKLKLLHQQEFVIGGYTEPSGSRRYLGALLVGYYEGNGAKKKLRFAGKVGTGFDARLLKTLHAVLAKKAATRPPFADTVTAPSGRSLGRVHWVRPQLVCMVRFSEWTRDNRLRHPVFLGLREDKKAAEVVREEAT